MTTFLLVHRRWHVHTTDLSLRLWRFVQCCATLSRRWHSSSSFTCFSYTRCCITAQIL